MRRILVYLLLAVSLGVYAQQQAGDPDAGAAETEQPAEAIAEAEAAVPEEEAEAIEDPEAEAEEPLEDDFSPEEEISEDFPVPLPSDI